MIYRFTLNLRSIYARIYTGDARFTDLMARQGLQGLCRGLRRDATRRRRRNVLSYMCYTQSTLVQLDEDSGSPLILIPYRFPSTNEIGTLHSLTESS